VIGYRPIELLVPDDPLFAGLRARPEVWKYHTHEVSELPAGFEVLASSGRCRYEVIRRSDAPVWGTQFHPEEADAGHPAGERMLANFFAAI
jgi:GMP synthase (glutamine-hydrolysing)